MQKNACPDYREAGDEVMMIWNSTQLDGICLLLKIFFSTINPEVRKRNQEALL